MRIVLTTNFSPWSRYSGGGQHSTHHLASALVRRRHDVTVVYTKPPWEQPEVPADLPYRLEWALLPAWRSSSGVLLRPASTLDVLRRARWLHAREPVHIVHGNGDEAALLPRLAGSSGPRFVMTPRVPKFPDALRADGYSFPSRVGRALRYSRYLLIGRALRGAHAWCPTSLAARDETARLFHLSLANCRVVPNGVNALFLETPRREVSLDGAVDKPRVVFFGRVAKEKGIFVLLEALARLGERAPGLDVIGRGPSEMEARSRAREEGLDVRWMDWQSQEQLARHLACAPLAVLPSLEESFGNAIVEAMAVGAAVITTDAGSIPEIATHDETAILVAAGQAEPLAQAIESLLASPRRCRILGERARTRMAQRYSWDATAKAYEEVYESLVSRAKWSAL